MINEPPQLFKTKHIQTVEQSRAIVSRSSLSRMVQQVSGMTSSCQGSSGGLHGDRTDCKEEDWNG